MARQPLKPAAPWSMQPTVLLAQLDSREAGLASAEAARRLTEIGPNTLRDDVRWQRMRIFLNQFRNPLVLILVGAGVVSLAVGDVSEFAIIVAIVLASNLLSFWQESAASQAMAKLLERLAHRVTVLRDGQQQTIVADELVPGDVMMLSAGSLIPADGIILSSTELEVTQAALTGEAFPVEKAPGAVAAGAELTDRTNMVFAGTSVRSGIATVVVTGTGANTEFAGIAESLRHAAPQTEFMRGVRDFGLLMTRIVLILVVVIFVVNIVLHRPFVDSLLFSLALAVGMTPELLPAIISVTLSHGARSMETSGVIVRRLHAIESLGSMDTLCTDKTGTLTEGAIKLESAKDAAGNDSPDILRFAALNATLQSGMANPLDEAIAASDLVKTTNLDGYEKTGEIPYDFDRKRLSVICRKGTDSPFLISKGALKNVLDCCSHIGSLQNPRQIDQHVLDEIEARFKDWSADGYRVLGVAIGSGDTETNLTFAGFLLFQDEPKAGVGATLAHLAAQGVRVKIITGDNRYAAAHIARQVGLSADRIVTGSDIDSLAEDALLNRVEDADLFAEIDPAQKEKVITALGKRGRVVGYLGDGINDAPALHAADVGISVDSAVDVAREAANIVLLQKSLDVLLDGISEGRRTFANTMKYISITTSANFGNMISMAAASLFLPFLPMLAKQILFNNFLSDVPSLAIATDNVDPEVVARPRGWDINYIKRFMIGFGGISSIFDVITFGFLLHVIHAKEPLFQTGWFVESLVTELGIVFVARTTRHFWKSRPGSLLLWLSVGIAVLAFAMPWTPVGDWMSFVHPTGEALLGLAIITTAYLAVSELFKRRLFARARAR